jgi:hypothetical protein
MDSGANAAVEVGARKLRQANSSPDRCQRFDRADGNAEEENAPREIGNTQSKQHTMELIIP